MPIHNHANHWESRQGGFQVSRTSLVLLGFLVIGGFLLFTEHRAHVLGTVVWLLPLACLFMHMFMHGAHSGHGTGRQPDERDPS
jgi:hypothetical protein